jgi:hypothetical protein
VIALQARELSAASNQCMVFRHHIRSDRLQHGNFVYRRRRTLFGGSILLELSVWAGEKVLLGKD